MSDERLRPWTAPSCRSADTAPAITATATLLPNGQVLVTGGFPPPDTATAELYTPSP